MKRNFRGALDDIEKMLIRELFKDGRQSNAELARKLGISKSTARRKLQRLLDEHVITVTALAYPPAIGFRIMSVLDAVVQPDMVQEVAIQLASYANIHHVFITSGSHDITAWMLFREPEDMSHFLRHELPKVSGIQSFETTIVLEITKRSYTYLGPDDRRYDDLS